MRWALEGGTITERNRPPAGFRDWQVVKLTGWTFDQLDAQPAQRVDWLLAIEATARDVERDAQEKAARDARHG